MKSFVSDRRTARPLKVQYFVSFESGFLTPGPEIGACKIKRIAKLDQHVQGHHQPKGIGAALVIN